MPISGNAMCPTVTPAPRRLAHPAVHALREYFDRQVRQFAAAIVQDRQVRLAPIAGLALPLLPLLLRLLLLLLLVIRAIAATRMCSAIVAVLEVVVRHTQTVTQPAFDRLHRCMVTVLAQVMVGFAGPHQRLEDFAFHQPAARRHGREPERGLVKPIVALAGRRRSQLGLDAVERRQRVGAAAFVARLLTVIRLVGFFTLRRAQDILDPARQWRRLMDRRASRHRCPATPVRKACARRNHKTAGTAAIDGLRQRSAAVAERFAVRSLLEIEVHTAARRRHRRHVARQAAIGRHQFPESLDAIGAAVPVAVDHQQAILSAGDRRQCGGVIPPGADGVSVGCCGVLPSLQQRALVSAGGKDLDAGSGKRECSDKVVLMRRRHGDRSGVGKKRVRSGRRAPARSLGHFKTGCRRPCRWASPRLAPPGWSPPRPAHRWPACHSLRAPSSH